MTVRSLLVVAILILVIGCAGNPVPVDLPLNHPSDPGAPESRFILPPNPFPDLSPQNQPNLLQSVVIHFQQCFLAFAKLFRLFHEALGYLSLS